MLKQLDVYTILISTLSRWFVGVSIVFCGSAAEAHAQISDQVVLQCFANSQVTGASEDVFASTPNEVSRLAQAPRGATRIGTHELKVAWDGGSREFADEPPYDEIGGLRWTYCGYSKAVNLHLIGKIDGSLSTGILINEITGTILPGGINVLFSPDRRFYAAYEQVDGEDGGNIKLYKSNGTLVSQGYDEIVAVTYDEVLVEESCLQQVHWSPGDKLLAVVDEPNEKSVRLVFSETGPGQFQWLRGDGKSPNWQPQNCGP